MHAHIFPWASNMRSRGKNILMQKHKWVINNSTLHHKSKINRALRPLRALGEMIKTFGELDRIHVVAMLRKLA